MPPDQTEFPLSETAMEAPPPLPAAREPFWGYTDLALFAGLLTASVALIIVSVGFLAVLYPPLRTDQTVALLPVQFVLYGFIYLCFFAVFRSRYDRPVFESLGWRRSNFNPMVAAIGGAILAFAVSGLAALLHTPKVDSPIDKLTKTPLMLAMFGVMAVTVAPLFEELVFRGFIQPLLSRTFGVIAGIGLTAIFFGALHAPEYSWAWQYALAVTIAGAVFGWLRARTNSIIPSTIMHGCYNLMFVIALAVTKHG